MGEVVLLLTKQFSRWVLLANLFAWPLAYFGLSKWLESFAYRTRLGVEIFLLASLGAFVVAIVTVSYQALRAASAHPVDSLRYE